jgi:hypothetical protein
MEFSHRDRQGRLINLVGGNDQGFSGPSKLNRNRFITDRQAVTGIDQKEDDISFPKGDIYLPHGLFIDPGLGFDDASGIDDKVLALTAPDPTVLTVTRQPRIVCHQGITGAREVIEEGGFADIGPADQGNNG